jgi:hypothetical protein
MMNVPTNVPDFCSLLTLVSRVCRELGNCSVYAPNIANASAMNNNTMNVMTGTDWKNACGVCRNASTKIAPAAA